MTILATTSCKKDVQCPAEDFVGTYMGDTECSLGLISEEDDLVVVSKLNDDTVEIEFQGEVLVVDIKGCNLEVDGNVTLGTGIDGTASLDGNTLTVSFQKKAATIIVSECDFTGVRI